MLRVLSVNLSPTCSQPLTIPEERQVKRLVFILRLVVAVEKPLCINTLIDLRQKQASISQANDTAKQPNTIFLFTIIKIVFVSDAYMTLRNLDVLRRRIARTQLPLSFLSSLFALDVASFPYKSDELNHQGWWLFNILCGVSAIIFVPTILLA
ncbi:uncharacterized protein FMAN_16262 [Fusarium mangiferae]|uniref:Uncharacterized protein n=1 Tax=Fusarium mangiferae TaxID=192010 RepID=A0A1L7UKK8_FUSMA|nr:uncharacterized protein FMAN_16262 [Fusarium mangiferae]CVL08615.1 uncharacterized protein FMAN_16262 [Fusarium mangiferae]